MATFTEVPNYKKRRQRVGLTQLQLGRRAGISLNWLAQVEKGAGTTPETQARIEAALDAAEAERGVTA
jgi:transcriptional regulator with XRE-family HTH domain